MKKFEYFKVSENDLERRSQSDYDHIRKDYPDSPYSYGSLNELGNMGWELVSVTQTYEKGTTYYFKREISE